MLEQAKPRKPKCLKYMEEWVESNLSEQVGLIAWINKLEMEYQLIKNTYNKSISTAILISYTIIQSSAQKQCMPPTV